MSVSSFVQTDFRGGLWSPSSQGRMDLPVYKTALNECLNSTPMEDGSWTRRPGFRFIAYPKGGVNGKMLPFRFSRSQAYQAILTPGYLRFAVGLTLLQDVTTASGEQRVVKVSKATPAVVKVPAINWSNGDTVIFNIVSDPPSSYTLYNRQFVINNINATKNTFELYDPVTGAAVSGAEINWLNVGGGTDTVSRVLEYVTPYSATDIPNVRIVQDSEDTVLFMCPGKKTYALVVSGLTQFTFGIADFQDGPYLDENELVTTLALSGLSGSVTVTASGTAGINEGDGFKTTDVGRLIWFQGGPAAWSNAVPYAKSAKVLGSDNNIYKSIKGNNLAHDPIVDTGTNWEITSDVVSITWLQITARSSTTVCTATIRGKAITSGEATIHWRMGVYSDTTGYPTCGAYHEGRLCLAGAIPGRFDMSVSFKALTFSPTEIDGTISDSNAVAGVLNNTDAELISSMLSIDEGLFIGTLAGEWVLKASALDDPISPTSVQARSPNNTGSANIEPMRIYGCPVFVQGRQRKIMTHRRVEGKWENVNHNKFASGLTSPKVVETAWSQEPMLSFFCRLSDGKLIGAIHKVSQLDGDGSFTGWHRHEHGMERTFTALSSGPNFSGTSDSVFVITKHPTDAAAPYWIETMMPVASEGDPYWTAWHTDGSGTGSYIRRMILANGDAYDGIKVYGLWHLNGETVHPFIGGLDLGDFVVSLGSIDLPYSGTFTAAFLAGLNDGTDYSDWGVQLRWRDAPVTTNPLQPLNTILVWDNEITTVLSGNTVLWDRDNEVAYRLNQSDGGPAGTTIRKINALTGDLIAEAANYNAIFPNNDTEGLLGVKDLMCLVPPDINHTAGSIHSLVEFTAVGTPPDGTRVRSGFIDCNTLVMYGVSYQNDVDPGTDTHAANGANSFSLVYPDFTTLAYENSNFVVVSKQGNGGRVALYGASAAGPIGTTYGYGGIMYETVLTGGADFTKFFRMTEVPGVTQFGSFSPFGNISSTAFGGATRAVFNEWTVGIVAVDPTLSAISVYPDNKFDISALSFDATWVDGFEEFSMTYCAYDDTYLVIANGRTVYNWRAVKMDREGAIVWNVAFPTAGLNWPPDQFAGPWNNHRWGYMADTGVIYELNLDTGVWTTFTGQETGFSILQDNGGKYDEVGPSLIVYASFATTGTPVPPPNFIGTWATAYNSWGTPNYARIWLGTSYTQDQNHRELNADYYFSPVNFGVSFVSRGQLLRPDYGTDAGTTYGPAFGKTRRIAEWAGAFSRAFNVKIGTDFTKLFPVKFQTPGKVPIQAPTLFSGVVADTLKDDYSYTGQIAWEVTRQYPCTITALGGFIQTQDNA